MTLPPLPPSAGQRPTFWQDSSPQTVLSGLIAILVGLAGPTVLIYAAARAAGLPQAVVLSWVAADMVLCGVVGILLSLRTRVPIIITWSTPGLAYLATALIGVPFPEAVGAFIVSNLLVVMLSSSEKWLGLVQRIPGHLAAALNAAILLPFGFHLVTGMGTQPLLVGMMVLGYFALRKFAPLWAVTGALFAGVVFSLALGLTHSAAVPLGLTPWVLTMPEFSLSSVVSISLPLTLLAFTGQYLPGFAILKVNGYLPRPAPIVRLTGGVAAFAALFGVHNLTLAALLANIVSGPEAHPDPARRYAAAVWAGVFYIAFGLFAGTFLGLLALLPAEAAAALAGLALLGAMSSSLQTAFRPAGSNLAAAVVVVVTLSGVSFLHVGAAFWGILAGLAVYGAEGVRQAPVPALRPDEEAPGQRVLSERDSLNLSERDSLKQGG
ncbi:benzoate/H(+) symporter BenE family transporter [Deinococcus sp.]|uniref:benzoate/H(+) symporter BenE family transporter n=1 Tax=Deinococcus sp. TaxID=47478 RepID=UPI0025F77FEF|nr:benzoate/H(+) symporter BenE family transporter [Deinococcus sp.]